VKRAYCSMFCYNHCLILFECVCLGLGRCVWCLYLFWNR